MTCPRVKVVVFRFFVSRLNSFLYAAAKLSSLI